MTLSILELLYIVLIVFTIIIWTLLAIILFKLIKFMEVLDDIKNKYEKTSNLISAYAAIPMNLMDTIVSKFKK